MYWNSCEKRTWLACSQLGELKQHVRSPAACRSASNARDDPIHRARTRTFDQHAYAGAQVAAQRIDQRVLSASKCAPPAPNASRRGAASSPTVYSRAMPLLARAVADLRVQQLARRRRARPCRRAPASVSPPPLGKRGDRRCDRAGVRVVAVVDQHRAAGAACARTCRPGTARRRFESVADRLAAARRAPSASAAAASAFSTLWRPGSGSATRCVPPRDQLETARSRIGRDFARAMSALRFEAEAHDAPRAGAALPNNGANASSALITATPSAGSAA